MWNRKEIKAKGKIKFKKNYWNSVVAGIVISGFALGSNINSLVSDNPLTEIGDFSTIVLYGFLIASISSIVLQIFVFNPLRVGGMRYFINNSQDVGRIENILYGFKSNYLNIVKVLFFLDIVIGLWTLLFIVPGIIKS